MRRRLLPACLALTGLFLVLPVISPPRPEPGPVTTAADEVPMGSVTAPAPAAAVRPGPTPAVRGSSAATPTLTVTRTHVRRFSMVGVTWAADAAVTNTVVQVRVQNAKGAWGHWTQVGIEDAVPNGDAVSGKKERGGTAPLWTGPSTGVQAELTARSGAHPADVKLDLIDPGTSAADSALDRPAIRDTAHAASSMPAVYSRGQWGADESIRTWGPQYAATIKAATIHHSADSNDYTADQVPALMRSIYRYHAVSLGWGDIGYNVVVDKFGRMWEGRYGGLASTVIGAHAGGFNTSTFGVSMLGNYDLVDTPPAVTTAVASVISWKFSLYGVNPRGTTILTSSGGGTSKYAAGVKVTLPTIFAHRDVGATVCPGRYAYARMDQIRDRVAGTVVDLTEISNRYDSDAGLRTLLGPQTTAPSLTADGSGGYATYQNGSLYYSPATGVRMLSGPVRDFWLASGGGAGILRYPTSDVGATADQKGEYARFQGGAVYSAKGTGTRAMLGPIQTLWNATGAETGVLGYPIWSVSNLPDGGQYATFEHGSIYWSAATGARSLSGPVRDAWIAGGAEKGALGYPTQDVTTAVDGVGQYAHFQRGSIYAADGGTLTLTGSVRDAWVASGPDRGVLGAPTSGSTGLTDGAGQVTTFTGGSIYWSPATGAQVLSGPIESLWKAAGAERSSLGYPTQGVSGAADRVGQYARFQRGVIFWSPGKGAHQVLGAINGLWAATGFERGPLGYPTAEEAGSDGVGRFSRFEHGSIFWSPTTGARAMLGPIEAAWNAAGAEQGFLGYPTQSVSTAADRVGQYARFQRGVIFWSPSSGAHRVLGAIGGLWAATGAERGVLGYPVSDELGTADGVGRFSRFQHGSIFWSPTTGTRVLLGPVEALWRRKGADTGFLGYPTQSVSWAADHVGQYARFQGGSIYWSPATGTWVVQGAFLRAWAAVGAEHGVLGYPIGDPYAVRGGQWQRFQHGYVAHSTATGNTWAVRQ
jgi:uncharacterized protein with LGFP repeats